MQIVSNGDNGDNLHEISNHEKKKKGKIIINMSSASKNPRVVKVNSPVCLIHFCWQTDTCRRLLLTKRNGLFTGILENKRELWWKIRDSFKHTYWFLTCSVSVLLRSLFIFSLISCSDMKTTVMGKVLYLLLFLYFVMKGITAACICRKETYKEFYTSSKGQNVSVDARKCVRVLENIILTTLTPVDRPCCCKSRWKYRVSRYQNLTHLSWVDSSVFYSMDRSISRRMGVWLLSYKKWHKILWLIIELQNNQF